MYVCVCVCVRGLRVLKEYEAQMRFTFVESGGGGLSFRHAADNAVIVSAPRR